MPNVQGLNLTVTQALIDNAISKQKSKLELLPTPGI